MEENKLQRVIEMALRLTLMFLALATVPVHAEAVPVRMLLQWTHQSQFAGYYVALEKGFYRERGLEVTIVPGGPSIEPADYLVRGEVDFASLWLSAALIRSENDQPLVNVAQIVNASNLVLVSRQQGEIKGLTELESV